MRSNKININLIPVSIHAPPEGRDTIIRHLEVLAMMFQSTRPRRGAISYKYNDFTFYRVSIHAPPEGRDLAFQTFRPFVFCFNPRAPGGARSPPSR